MFWIWIQTVCKSYQQIAKVAASNEIVKGNSLIGYLLKAIIMTENSNILKMVYNWTKKPCKIFKADLKLIFQLHPFAKSVPSALFFKKNFFQNSPKKMKR